MDFFGFLAQMLVGQRNNIVSIHLCLSIRELTDRAKCS
jgi:hypothetical protein